MGCRSIPPALPTTLLYGSTAVSEPHSIESLSDEAFGWYFTGLTDGEGHFGMYRYVNPKTGNVGFGTNFRIAMRMDESEHITAVARRFGCGKLYHKSRQSQRDKGKADGDSVSWDVTRINDLFGTLVAHFERFPLQFKKRDDYKVWMPAVVLMHGKSKLPRKCWTNAGRTRYTDEDVKFLEDTYWSLRDVRKYFPKKTKTFSPEPLIVRACPLFPDF